MCNKSGNGNTSTSTSSTSSTSKSQKRRVRVDLSLCKYEVIRKVVRDRGWKIVDDEEDKEALATCNLHWIDVPEIQTIFRMVLPYQKVNHFPGMTNLARKSKLARNFERMHKLFPQEYDFCPKTWILPFDLHDFQTNFNAEGVSNKTFIVKPDHSCQGRGVFLTRRLDNINKQDIFVAQQYITKPFLIEGKKFDLRIYILVASCDPLRVYLFKDGLVRMCTADYVSPNADNMEQRFMHLTNYAVNKHSNNFEVAKTKTDDGQSGSKRSLTWFFQWLGKQYEQNRVDALWEKIGDICLKAIIAVQPTLEQEYKSTFARYLRKQSTSSSAAGAGGAGTGATSSTSCRDTRDEPGTHDESGKNSQRPISAPEGLGGSQSTKGNHNNSCCFALLGMDVLVDENLRPWLLEVNHLPSFGTDAQIDWNIKERLINQTFDILNISAEDKDLYEAEQAKSLQSRLYGTLVTSPTTQAGSAADKEENNGHTTTEPECGGDFKTGNGSAPVARLLNSIHESSLLSLDELAHALKGFYKQVNPDKLVDIDKIVTKYGQEQHLLDQSLMEKYGKSLLQFTSTATSQSLSRRRQQQQSSEPQSNATGEEEEEEEDNEQEQLIDYIRIFPPSQKRGDNHQQQQFPASNYVKLLQASQDNLKEQQMRFSAPLQHRKTLDENGGVLPPVKGAKKAELGRDCFGVLGTDKAKQYLLSNADKDKQKALPMPNANQVAAAHRLMLGHSSQKLSIKPPTPPEGLPTGGTNSVASMRKDNVDYGLAYRERLESLRKKPTIAITHITFGNF